LIANGRYRIMQMTRLMTSIQPMYQGQAGRTSSREAVGSL
jgi:hypothetical protein